MTEYIKQGKEMPDIIYCHNDDMATGAYDAIKEAGLNPDDIIIVGTDGASGENGGIKAVMDGKIDVTFFYPDGSEEAIKAAEAILSRETVEKNIILSTVQIDDNNAEGLYGQMNMTRIQEERIIDQSMTLLQRDMTINTQNNILILVISLLGAVMVALAYISKLHNDKKKSNQVLNEKNAEINAQKEELESQASYLNQINEQLERNISPQGHRERRFLLVSPRSRYRQRNAHIRRHRLHWTRRAGCVHEPHWCQPARPDCKTAQNLLPRHHPRRTQQGCTSSPPSGRDRKQRRHGGGIVQD